MPLPYKAGIASAVIIALSPVSTTVAENTNDDPITIVITGTRTAQTVDQSLAPVTVITRDDIEARQATSVEEILRGTPGLTITNNGGAGKESSIFLRGTESDHVLVLIDGIKIGSATSGKAAFQNIPLEQIERIEIVRGPRSSLYGSEAIGGVIQLFTRKPAGATQPEISVAVGSHSTQAFTAGLSGANGKGGWYSTQYANTKTDGFDSCRGKPFPEGAGCFTSEPDKDGYDNQSLSLAGGIQLGQRINISARALSAEADTEYDGSLVNRSESTNSVLGLNTYITVTDIWKLSLLMGQSEDESDNFKDQTFVSRFDTTRDYVTLQNDVHIGDALVTLGTDYYNDKVDSTTTYNVTSRDNIAYFMQYQNQIGQTDLQLALRSDDNEQFGTETTGGLALGRDLGDGLRLTASYGTAFKAPSFNDLYFPGFANSDLDAETADSIDIGLSGRSGHSQFAVNLFETNIDNLITYDIAANQPINVGKARITGVELSFSTPVVGWILDSQLTLQAPRNKGEGEQNGNTLARRAENSVRISMNRQFGALKVGATINSQGHSFDDLANSKRLNGFTTLDLGGEYQLNNDWSLGLKVNNVLDESYETASYYNQDGINAMLKLRYRPGQ